MSGTSSSPAAWWSHLEPTPEAVFYRRGDSDDPRLGDVVVRWDGQPLAFRAGQPVIVGFPCDEGVRRNGGRPGAAQAPNAIRESFYRMTSWDDLTRVDLGQRRLLDLGNIRMDADLETVQARLGEVVGALLAAQAVPIILGGGHETAYGHYLGYVNAGIACGILNIDAHLDVRPYPHGRHSGSPFRQAMEHPTHPLPDGGYAVLGAQRQSVARAHADFVRDRGGRVSWLKGLDRAAEPLKWFTDELDPKKTLMLTVDADAFRQADVPGVSAPNPNGLDGSLWPVLAQVAGRSNRVRSLDLVEVNPLFDRDQQTVRWAALGLRQFLVGLACRERQP